MRSDDMLLAVLLEAIIDTHITKEVSRSRWAMRPGGYEVYLRKARRARNRQVDASDSPLRHPRIMNGRLPII